MSWNKDRRLTDLPRETVDSYGATPTHKPSTPVANHSSQRTASTGRSLTLRDALANMSPEFFVSSIPSSRRRSSFVRKSSPNWALPWTARGSATATEEVPIEKFLVEENDNEQDSVSQSPEEPGSPRPPHATTISQDITSGSVTVKPEHERVSSDSRQRASRSQKAVASRGCLFRSDGFAGIQSSSRAVETHRGPAIDPLSTHGLAPLQQRTRHGMLEIVGGPGPHSGAVLVDMRGREPVKGRLTASNKATKGSIGPLIRISADGFRIDVLSTSSSSSGQQGSPSNTNSSPTDQSYTFSSLPPNLARIYRYAARWISRLRARTSIAVFAAPCVRTGARVSCSVMANDSAQGQDVVLRWPAVGGPNYTEASKRGDLRVQDASAGSGAQRQYESAMTVRISRAEAVLVLERHFAAVDVSVDAGIMPSSQRKATTARSHTTQESHQRPPGGPAFSTESEWVRKVFPLVHRRSSTRKNDLPVPTTPVPDRAYQTWTIEEHSLVARGLIELERSAVEHALNCLDTADRIACAVRGLEAVHGDVAHGEQEGESVRPDEASASASASTSARDTKSGKQVWTSAFGKREEDAQRLNDGLRDDPEEEGIPSEKVTVPSRADCATRAGGTTASASEGAPSRSRDSFMSPFVRKVTETVLPTPTKIPSQTPAQTPPPNLPSPPSPPHNPTRIVQDDPRFGTSPSPSSWPTPPMSSTRRARLETLEDGWRVRRFGRG